MASDKLLLHEPQWTYAEIKWYISSTPVKRILGKSGNAPAGTIFEVDYKHSKLDEKQKKEVVLKSCHKGTWKVKWAPRTFYGLDDDSKNLLLALADQHDRLRFYVGMLLCYFFLLFCWRYSYFKFMWCRFTVQSFLKEGDCLLWRSVCCGE